MAAWCHRRSVFTGAWRLAYATDCRSLLANGKVSFYSIYAKVWNVTKYLRHKVLRPDTGSHIICVNKAHAYNCSLTVYTVGYLTQPFLLSTWYQFSKVVHIFSKQCSQGEAKRSLHLLCHCGNSNNQYITQERVCLSVTDMTSPNCNVYSWNEATNIYYNGWERVSYARLVPTCNYCNGQHRHLYMDRVRHWHVNQMSQAHVTTMQLHKAMKTLCPNVLAWSLPLLQIIAPYRSHSTLAPACYSNILYMLTHFDPCTLSNLQ